MKKKIAFILIVICILLTIPYFLVRIHVLRLSDGKTIGLSQMIEEVKGERIIFVGEEHDRVRSHRAELEIIRKLNRAGVHLAIGMEMFTAGSQERLDQWVAGKLNPDDFIALYYRNWQMPWPYYRDILNYARDHRIPLIGLNIREEISLKVARKGLASLTQKERSYLPGDVTCSIDPMYRAFIDSAYKEHPVGEMPFTYFCEAQMLWNRSMGQNLLKYLEKNPDKSVVVLTGVGHAMKPGIPAELNSNSGYSYRVILPKFADMNKRTISSESVDYLLLFGWWPIRFR